MASSIRKINESEATRRMYNLMNGLTIEELRILARLLNDWEKRDQRQHPRTPCSIITEYMVQDRAHRDKIKNISLGGAFIESRQSFPVNLEIAQSFFFPNFEIPIQSKSKIVWIGPNGFGVQFENLESNK